MVHMISYVCFLLVKNALYILCNCSILYKISLKIKRKSICQKYSSGYILYLFFTKIKFIFIPFSQIYKYFGSSKEKKVMRLGT